MNKNLNSICRIVLAILFTHQLQAQTTITLTPWQDGNNGFHTNYNSANTNYGHADYYGAFSQPGASGGENAAQSIMQFDLSSIPSGTTISSATLDLYGRGPLGANGDATSVGNIGDNACYLERITSAWQQYVVTWNTRPSLTHVDAVTLPQSQSTIQDYLGIDVRQLVQDMVDDPDNSYGFSIRLITEDPTRGLFFCSTDYSDQSKWPVLTVTYSSCVCAPPTITSIDSICGNVSSVCWSSVQCATEYILRWNVLPDETWIYESIAAPDTCHQFTNHFGDVNQLQLASVCQSGDTSDYSPVVTWNNYLVCAAPTDVATSNVTDNSADLSWNANPDANKYEVFYKINGNITKVKVNGTTYSLTGLPSSTPVKWRVKARCSGCDGHSWGNYSPFQYFTTLSQKQINLGQQSTSTLEVFPNPADVNFTVNFNLGYSSQQSYTLAVQDIVGHVMMVHEGTLTNGLLSQDISLSDDISNGVYTDRKSTR